SMHFAESPAPPATAVEPHFTENGLLGNRLRLRQLQDGYRVAIDSVLLAAAVEARNGLRVVEFGAGVGAVSLCLGWRLPQLRLTGNEYDGALVALSQQNLRLNHLTERITFLQADVTRLVLPESARFDQLIMNPPFHDGASDPSPDLRRNRAFRGADLAAWLNAAARALQPSGRLTVIFRADRRTELLATLQQSGFGGLEILPILPRQGRPPKRILVRGTLGADATVWEARPLILHNAKTGYAAAAEAIFQGGGLPWQDPGFFALTADSCD
ncbi:MAG: methyltransferase, partial [Alphaproteobacteria bacterium]|nr:methyltransferase [Alphaproteobacteria bacterium]